MNIRFTQLVELKMMRFFQVSKLVHNPFLVFTQKDNELHVLTIDNADSLLAFPDDTPVMVQWPGKYRSDFFQFEVGDFRKWKS